MSKADTITSKHGGLLTSWMHWYSLVLLAIGGFFLCLFLVRESPASLVIGSTMIFIYFPLTLYGSRKARNGRFNPALASIAFVCWSLSLVVAGRGITALPVTLPLALLPMIISLPYISPLGLKTLGFGTFLVCVTSVTLTLFDPLLPSNLEEATLAIIMVPVTSLALGLAILGLWQVGSRLRKVLSDTESTNRALAESERSLEANIHARTADLENALAEISDIESIAATVNVTLDLDEVIAAMGKALQRVFQFDNISIFLLDETRRALTVHRVAGIELDPDKHGLLLDEGLSLNDEDNIVVAAFTRGKSLLVPEIGEEQLAAMTSSDRYMLDLNPVRSVLMCPLEIEDKHIGVVGFGRLQEPMLLEAEEIDRIQRYITPLATVIRNARLFDETRQARAEAVESSKAKSQFLANMSHELRTPLNAIIGYSEMLIEDAEDDGQQDYLDDLHKVHTSGLFLLELIGSVLDLTKIEAGKLQMDYTRFDVSALLKELVSTSQPLADRNRNALELSGREHHYEMHSDQAKVRQILLNLLSNAAKFTEDGSITLEVDAQSRQGETWICFTVTDTGIGMSADQLDRVFEAFTQADESTSRKYGGTGLGLTITREFCEMLGGEISVKSETGKGSTFVVSLPAESPGTRT